MNATGSNRAYGGKRFAVVSLLLGFGLGFALNPVCLAGKREKSKATIEKDAFNVGDVVKAIEEVVKESADKPVAGVSELTGVTLTFKTDRNQEARSGGKLLNFTIAAKQSPQRTTKHTLCTQ